MVHVYVMVMIEVDETAFGIVEFLAVVDDLVMDAVSATCNAAAAVG